MGLARAVASLALNAGPFARGMAAEASIGARGSLHDAERIFQIRAGLEWMAGRQSQTVASAIPGQAVLHPPPLALNQRSDCLHARSECPRDHGIYRLASALDAHLGAIVGEDGAVALAELSRVKAIAAKWGERVGVGRDLKGADTLCMTGLALRRSGRGEDSQKQKRSVARCDGESLQTRGSKPATP